MDGAAAAHAVEAVVAVLLARRRICLCVASVRRSRAVHNARLAPRSVRWRHTPLALHDTFAQERASLESDRHWTVWSGDGSCSAWFDHWSLDVLTVSPIP